MKPYLRLAIASCVCACLSACQNNFQTYNEGLQYLHFAQGQGETVQPGETLKLQIKQVYNDSVLSNTRDSLPFYQLHDSTQLSAAAYDIFSRVRKGDSLIFRALTDSAFKSNLPAFVKKGTWLETHVYVQDILGPKQDFRDDLKWEMERRRPPTQREK